MFIAYCTLMVYMDFAQTVQTSYKVSWTISPHFIHALHVQTHWTVGPMFASLSK